MELKHVRLKWKGKVLEGLLLPSPDDKTLVLKLKSGYNIGLAKNEVEIIEGKAELPIKQVAEEAHAEEKVQLSKDEVKGKVVIVGCGGTIASKIDYKTGAVYPSISADELLSSFPKLSSIADIAVENPLSIFSEEMEPAHWELIADEAYRLLSYGARGVVILHGTDTLAYTASALSFAVGTDRPIVLTGAQRSSDRPSSDNEDNLLNSIFAAEQDFGEVVVCMHAGSSDGLCHMHRGTRVRKMHSSRRDAFQTVNGKPLARVFYTGLFEPLELSSSSPSAGSTIPDGANAKSASVFSGLKKGGLGRLELRNGFDRDVALLYVYPGMKPEVLEAYKGYKGLVLAGTGLGHLAVSKLKSALKDLIDDGVYVYMTTQTLGGRVNMNVYSSGRELLSLGVRGNFNDMLPETAYVKLSWAIKHASSREELDRLMNTNLVGEMSERSLYI